RIPARPIRAVVRGPREGSGGAREGSGEGTGERKAVRHAMIANAPPDSLRECVLLRDSMAGPFRSLTSIGPADHGKEVSLAGWAEDVRNLGGIAFLIVRQRAGTFQITVKKGDAELFNRASKIVRESVVAARGIVQPNRQVRNGWELLATSVDVLSPAAAPLPLPVADKVGADMDTRFDNRTLDLRKPERRAIFHIRSLVESAVRGYLGGQAFVEVHTPKLAGAGAEGGATLFQTDYFGRRAYLSQSQQLYKPELLQASPQRPKVPFKRLAYREALEILRGGGKRVRDGDDIDTEGEKLLGQSMAKEGHAMYFLTGYPAAIKPFYVMADADDPQYSYSFDLEYKGDEMASGGQREHRYDQLGQRMKEDGRKREKL